MPRTSRAPRFTSNALSTCLFAIGAAGAWSFIRSPFPNTWLPLLAVAAASTAMWLGAGLTGRRDASLRWLGRLCQVGVVAMYALWLYLGIVFGFLLGWTVPLTFRLLIITVAAVTLWTWLRPVGRLRVPIVLPLGVWIAVVLSGWVREEWLLRCDDALSLAAPVQLLVAGNARIKDCRPGEVIAVGRYPRTTWEDHERGRLVFTTQGAPTPDGLPGSFCEVSSAGGGDIHCVGPAEGKSQGIAKLPNEPTILAMQYGVRTPGGKLGAVTFEIDISGPLKIVREHWFDELTGEGFYEPSNATLYMFSDELNGVHRVQLPSFERKPTIPIEWFTPGELRYDEARGEGIACARNLGVAIRGNPFTARDLTAGSHDIITRLSMTWGCDWDEAKRQVYTAIPNLGLLTKIDYDTGEVKKRWFVGPGLRSVAYDPARQMVYLSDFLRGYVVAFDERAERVTARWFIGRFARWVRLTHDGRALLATSNLGIVRIPLDEPPSR